MKLLPAQMEADERFLEHEISNFPNADTPVDAERSTALLVSAPIGGPHAYASTGVWPADDTSSNVSKTPIWSSVCSVNGSDSLDDTRLG